MKIRKTISSACSLLLVFCLTLPGHSQSGLPLKDTASYPFWINMMQDPGANFHSVQSAFNKYWANRTDYRHNGWKVFKRWEYINETRVMPDGKLPPADWVRNEYLKEMSAPQSANGNWTLVGPTAMPTNATGQPNGLGRINTVAFHPTDANTVFVGAPSGGLWKSTDAGTSWAALTANLPTLGVSSILVHPSTPTTIFVGTGDRDAGDAPGLGVYKSTDGGATWTPSNTGMGNLTVGMMIMHPSDPNTILAATSGGIYKTTTGGTSWTRTSSNTSNYKDIKFKPGDPTIIYATENGNFYRSINTGGSWTQVTSANGVIAGTRLVIGVTAANSAYVYLLQTNGAFAGVLRSTDSGQTFATQSTTPNIMDYACDGSGTGSQAWYDLCIAVDPANANTLYLGGVNIWKSINGGTTLTINSHWVGSSWGTSCAPSVHADIHALFFSPLNGKLYTGCDGGVYVTSTGGTSWTNITSGISIAQVYRIGQSATVQGMTMNGYQDNGTSSSNGTTFTTVIGGDGMECIIDYSNSNYRYGALYYGAISRTTTGSGYSTIAGNGSNGITESGAWVTPYILHATDPNTMFIGYKNVWRSNNVKASSSGSVTWTAISSGETTTCAVLEQSPADVNVLYVVWSGQLKRTDNANAASVIWTTCALPGGYTPTDLAAHPANSSIVYATANYGVYKSIDKGATWSNISGNLPSSYTNCLVYDKNSNEGIYVGNETGIWYKDATLQNWVQFNTGLPVISVRELEIYYNASTPSSNRIKAATYGRGLWQSDLNETGVINPSNFAASTISTSQINLSWTRNASNNNVVIAWSPSGTFGTPVNGISYYAGNTIPGGGTILYAGSGISFNHTLLAPNTTYYYNAWSVDGTKAYSSGTGVNATTLCSVFLPPFSESFTAATIPNCWTQADNQGNGQVWVFGTLSGQSPDPVLTGNYAYLNSDGYGSGNSQNADLVSPLLDLTSYTGIVLSFNHYFKSYSGSSGTVSYSTNNGSTWTALTSFNSTSATNPAAFSQVIPSLTGQSQVKFKWNYTGTWGWYWAIDDIQVSGTVLPLLSVTPSNQNLTAASGSTSFTVTSNSGWTASSNQAWCTVTPSGSGNGTISATCSANGTSSSRVASITVSVSGLTPVVVTVTQAGVANITLNLTLLLQGLYSGSGNMFMAHDATGPHWGGTIADKINVELHSSSAYSTIVFTANNIDLNTNGTATVIVPGTYNGSYYITIRHRNSLATVTSLPVSFSSGTVSYNFTTAVTSAYGNNLLSSADNRFLIYAGDVSQDGVIDAGDLTTVENASTNFISGYVVTDVNGDGVVDSADLTILDNNSSVFIRAIVP